MQAKFGLGLCAALGLAVANAEPSDVREREISVPKCAAPVAKVIVSEIKCKSADCSSDAGQTDPRVRRAFGRPPTPRPRTRAG